MQILLLTDYTISGPTVTYTSKISRYVLKDILPEASKVEHKTLLMAVGIVFMDREW